jgi:hypothetical protein
MTARNLAIEALYAGQEARTFSERLKAHALGRAAIAALEAETGEPVAWIDPCDLAVLTCPDVEEFGARRFAGVSGRPSGKNTLPLYTSQPPAAPEAPACE